MKYKIEHSSFQDFGLSIDDESVQLIWTDPPFNTGDVQRHSSGTRYTDRHNDYTTIIHELGQQAKAILKPDGVLAVCLDYRSVHEVKVILDEYLTFQGEIIWHFELGNIAKKWWTNKHNTILTFTKNQSAKFYFERIPKIERKSPKGKYQDPKPITSVWNYTMSNTAPERVNYPNQKPIEIITPFVQAHTDIGEVVYDPFMGSGSTIASAILQGRVGLGCDANVEAYRIAHERLEQVVQSHDSTNRTS